MFNINIKESTTEQLYSAVLAYTQDKIADVESVSGDRTVYYMSAEFLIGKLLSNNLMNLKIYDEVAAELAKYGRDITELEQYEPEPALGNGGLGRLAACFVDSIATLGINGQGLGLVYHYGLFKQVFERNLQTEVKDVWLDKPTWLRKTDFSTTVKLGDLNVTSRMYEMDVLGYNNKKSVLRLFDLESIDDTVITSGISFDQSEYAKNLALFLYPDDSTEEGLRLRFAQQYFMVQSGLAWILKDRQDHLHTLNEDIVIQINDTHPSLTILLLFKELLNHGIELQEAIKIVENTFAYTNHTILAEALEKWPLAYFEAIDPSLVAIIKQLDEVVKNRSADKRVVLVDENNLVHMASLAIHFSYSVNGVAALHTDILKNSELKHFNDLYPTKFNNKTNGITFRRWLAFSNKPLTAYLDGLIGNDYMSDADHLEKLLAYREDKDVLNTLIDIKHGNKVRLQNYLKQTQNIDINPDSIFDIQIKRLHEYKRQQMNLLYIIHMYQEIKAGLILDRPLTVFFGSKAAPAYTIAKDIIHALLTVSKIIENDPVVSKQLQVVFVENYNVTLAEYLIPAADISEQISLASKEASGTGNMKFMLNGALTLGTLDGANVEIAELVGEDNIYIFGEHSETIIEHYAKADYVSRDYYENSTLIKDAVDFIVSDLMLELGSKENLKRLHHELISKDWFMTLIDLEDYISVKNEMLKAYEDREDWSQKTLVNIAKAGFFSSDRTIMEYDRDIWKTNKY
ncbi:MAG: glycogen/starch/alpha-glucan phosphorylase [Erysipelothrix sp.]|nr:glycogen/starch/alpha-glucan phosphorylase [Erysipelothrix sp.]